MSRAEEHRALFERWFEELWNRKNYAITQELVHPDFTAHGAGGQDIKQGPDGVAEMVRTWHKAFPDGHMAIDDIITEDDISVIRMTFRGTHLDEFYGNPASGKKVEVTSIGIDRVVDGQITEGWGELNMLGLMQQIGAIPDPSDEEPPAQSAVEHNRRMGMRMAREIWSQGKLEVVDELLSDDYIGHVPNQPGPVRGPEGFKQMVQSYRAAMPDLRLNVNDQIVTSDRLVLYWTAAGTNTGPMGEVPPSNNAVSVEGVTILRIADGKIVQEWEVCDTLGFAVQLGLLPMPGQ